MNQYLAMWKRASDCAGRSTRLEFFSAIVGNILVIILIGAAALVFDPLILLSPIYLIAALVPMFSLSVRRLHDTGKSGPWMLLCLIPGLGWLFLFCLLCMPGNESINRWGVPHGQSFVK